jgi:hypothetical protein
MDLFVQGRPVPMEPSSSRCTISHHRCSFPSTPGCWLTLLPTLSNVSGTPLDHRRRKSALRVVGAAILGGHHPLPLGFGRCQCISAPPVAGDTYTGFFFLYMFLANQWFIFSNFLLCCPSQRSARSQVPSQVATHQEIGSQLWAGETLDSNPGLQDNSLARYH